jgi:hypothetical protein
MRFIPTNKFRAVRRGHGVRFVRVNRVVVIDRYADLLQRATAQGGTVDATEEEFRAALDAVSIST